MDKSLLNSYPDGLFKDEVVILTGSGQGIGRCAAFLFAKEGAKIVICDIVERLAKEVVGDLHAQGSEAIAVVGDVTAPDFPKRVIDSTIQAFGKINHIVTLAGFPLRSDIKDMPNEQMEMMMNIHVHAPFRLIREAAPYFLIEDPSKRENRSIVTIGSAIGLHGGPALASYATAKAAIIGFTKSLAKEWGPYGVRCNVASFGMIHTRLSSSDPNAKIDIDGKTLNLAQPQEVLDGMAAVTPLLRGGRPEEGASGVFFLCSPLASFVSGHVMEIAGGFGI